MQLQFRTSYFYQVRYFNANILPFSTALSDPKWFHEDKSNNHIFLDIHGVVNGLRCEPIIEKGLIISFRTLIKYIGMFRNMLAHNQPIYCYNHKDYCLINFPTMSYDIPWVDMKKNSTLPEIVQQHKINSVTMYDLEIFFGQDKYNANNSCKDINLSFIIYIIYKIIINKNV